jgi:DNA-binding PucR family transcriptional regulator
LASFGGEEEAREYVQETLGKLIAHDRQKKTNLLHTLEVILESGSLKEAAQRLFLHYNTAVLHKRRIEKIVGAAIEDAETRLMLATAVKLYRLGL